MKGFRKYFQSITAVTALFVISSCEDQVYPVLEPAAPILVVDAWITNRPETQMITLMQTQPYFDSATPPPVSGAVVSIADNVGKIYTFVEDDKNKGNYLWTPAAGEVFGTVGNKYVLTIQVNGETFQASSYMGRVPPIDSVNFITDKRIANSDSITRAEFWATDPVGPGDAYWIRARKNGILLNKPNELNYSYDGGFSMGAETDGVVFLPPIRRGINPNEQQDDGLIKQPYEVGDSVYVEILSITKAAFTYLGQVAIQTNRPGGFSELFSTPLANVSTNIDNVNADGSKAVGFFNVSAVSSAGKRRIK